jgi:hypothetical protein
MARVISATSIVAPVAASLVDNEDFFVLPGVTLGSSGSTGVVAGFDFHDIMIAGAVFGGVNGINLGKLASKLIDTTAASESAPRDR